MRELDTELSRTLRVALDKLRTASIELVAWMQTMEMAGADVDALLEALRLEYADWQRSIAQMNTVSNILNAMGASVRVDAVILTDQPLSDFEDRKAWAHDAGRVSFLAGRFLKDNPYKAGTPDALQWRLGWISGREGEKSV